MYATSAVAIAAAAPPAASVGPFGGTGHAIAEANRTLEEANVPLAFAGDPRELAVGIHRDRMADQLEHRQVGDRVGVRVRRREVESLGDRHLAHRFGLVRRVRVELELAGVTTLLVDAGTGRDHVVDAEVLADRFDGLGRRRRDDHRFPPGLAVLFDQLERFGVDDRREHVVERLADELLDVLLVPARA